MEISKRGVHMWKEHQPVVLYQKTDSRLPEKWLNASPVKTDLSVCFQIVQIVHVQRSFLLILARNGPWQWQPRGETSFIRLITTFIWRCLIVLKSFKEKNSKIWSTYLSRFSSSAIFKNLPEISRTAYSTVIIVNSFFDKTRRDK